MLAARSSASTQWHGAWRNAAASGQPAGAALAAVSMRAAMPLRLACTEIRRSDGACGWVRRQRLSACSACGHTHFPQQEHQKRKQELQTKQQMHQQQQVPTEEQNQQERPQRGAHVPTHMLRHRQVKVPRRGLLLLSTSIPILSLLEVGVSPRTSAWADEGAQGAEGEAAALGGTAADAPEAAAAAAEIPLSDSAAEAAAAADDLEAAAEEGAVAEQVAEAVETTEAVESVTAVEAEAEDTSVVTLQTSGGEKVKGRPVQSVADEDRLLDQNRRIQRLNGAPDNFPGFIRQGFEVTVVVGPEYKVAPSGLIYWDIVEGTGELPTEGQQVEFHYTGYNESGRRVDSTYLQGRPAKTRVGINAMIPGFEEGLSTMKVGGSRRIIIPPELGPPTGPSTFFSAKQYEVFDISLLSSKTCERRQVLFYSDVVCD